jgi:hypothetical protein
MLALSVQISALISNPVIFETDIDINIDIDIACRNEAFTQSLVDVII